MVRGGHASMAPGQVSGAHVTGSRWSTPGPGTGNPMNADVAGQRGGEADPGVPIRRWGLKVTTGIQNLPESARAGPERPARRAHLTGLLASP